jgi:hypothetical protein
MPGGGGGGLPNLGPVYIQVPFVSPGWAVGVLFQLHILVAAFIMGVAWMLVFTGFRPATPRFAWHERFTKSLALWLVETYSFGATLAVFAITVLLGLFPRYLSVLVSALGVPLAVIFGAWLIQVLSLVIFYYTWDRWRPRHRWAHQSIMLLYSIAETAFIVMITLYTAYQITPPHTPTLTSAVSNPTWFPEALHRVAGNFSYAGYLIAAWGAWRTWRRRREATSVDRAYYHWVMHLGFLWGLSFELTQIPIGTYYVLAIQRAGPRTYAKMMLTRGTAAEWLLQILLVAAMFVLGDIYIWLSMRRWADLQRGGRALARIRALAPVAPGAGPVVSQAEAARGGAAIALLGARLDEAEAPTRSWLERWAEPVTRWGLVVMVAALVLAVLPDGIPVIGSMTAKWVALGIFLVQSLVNLVFYVGVSRRWFWGNVPAVALWALMAGGLCIALLMATMGIIRYTNPQTSVIEHQVPLPPVRVQSILTPVPVRAGGSPR